MSQDHSVKEIAQRIAANCPVDRQAVLAIRANDLAFLGLLRGIASAGAEPICVTYTWPGAGPWFSEKSRHFQHEFPIVNPLENHAEAAARLVVLGKELFQKLGRRSLVLPSSDSVQLLFFQYETELSPYFDLMGDSQFQSFRAEVTNKGSFFELLAAEHPELCPKTFWCRNAEDLNSFKDLVPFPAIVKPAIKDYQQSFYRVNKGSKAITVNDQRSLIDTVTTLLKQGFELVVQERVVFDSVHDEIPFYTYIDRKNRVRLAASGIKEFIQPHPYGTATVLRLSSHPELIENAQKVAKAIRWTGTLMIEFIRDQADGNWKVIEVNTRPWLFHDFYRRFGMDFVPHAILDHAGKLAEPEIEGQVKVPDPSKLASVDPVHVDLRTIATDVYAENARSQNASAADLISFVGAYSRNHTLPHSSPDDPSPGAAMLEMLATDYGLDLKELTEFGLDGSCENIDLTHFIHS